jgi:NADPH:quinone reductase-like Zn-dependent oxidoreductase
LSSNLFSRATTLSNVRTNPAALDYIREMIDSGDLDPIGEATYAMEETPEAMRALAAGGHKGKLVIRIEEFEKVCPVGGMHSHCS